MFTDMTLNVFQVIGICAKTLSCEGFAIYSAIYSISDN